MAVTITAADLAAALRVGETPEETLEVTRLLAYCTEAISKNLGDAYADAPEVIVNEAVVRLAGYQYDRPYAPPGEWDTRRPWRTLERERYCFRTAYTAPARRPR